MFVKKLFAKKAKANAIVETESIESTVKATTLTFTHHWTLDNFSHLYDKNCQWKWEVESEEFTMPENEEWKFSLNIWPKVKGKNGEEYLGVGMCTRKIPTMWEGKVTVKEKCSIVDEEKGRKLWGEEYTEREVLKNIWTADYEYLPVEKLLDSSESYLKSGILRVLCEMTFHCPEAIFTIPSPAQTFSHTSIPASVSSFSHSFTLSHFKWLCEDRTRQMPLKVESKYFAPEREYIGKWRIEFCPKGWEGKDEENVGILIRNENKSSLLLHWECFLLDGNGDKCHQFENTHRIPLKTGKFHSLSRRHLLSLLDSLPTDELTFNCHVTVLGKGEQKKPPSHTITTPTTSHLDFALFTFHYVPFTWTIEFLEKLNRHSIESRIFSPSTDSRYQFNLRLYPNKNKENVTLALHFGSTSFIEESKVNCSYSLVNTMEDEWNRGVDSDFISKPTQFGPYVLISHRSLSNFASSLLPEGKLTIKCELWIYEPHKELPPELRNPPPPANNSITSLSAGVTQVNISHSQISNSILASQSTISTGNIHNTLNSTSAEASHPK